jgi:hypothetical protein
VAKDMLSFRFNMFFLQRLTLGAVNAQNLLKIQGG